MDHDEHPAGAGKDVMAAHRSEVCPHEPGTCPEADEGGKTLATGDGGLGIGEGEVRSDLGFLIRRFGPLARQRHGTSASGQYPGCHVSQVGAHRAPRGGRDRREPDSAESLDHGGMEQHLGAELEATGRPERSKAGGSEQKRLGPGLARRPGSRHHCPGEVCRLGGHAIGPEPRDGAPDLV